MFGLIVRTYIPYAGRGTVLYLPKSGDLRGHLLASLP